MCKRLILAVALVLLACPLAHAAAPAVVSRLGGLVPRGAPAPDLPHQLSEVIQAIVDSSVLEMRREKLAGWALRGLFRQRGKAVPPDLQRRLEPARPLDEKKLLAVLRAAFTRAYPGGVPADAQAILDEAIRFMLWQFDPDAKWGVGRPYNDEPRRQPSYPGLRLAVDAPSGMVRVITPLKGGPAYKAGLRAGDLITHIKPASEPGEPAKATVSTRALSVEKAERLLLGYEQTLVRLTVRRDGERRPLVFEVKLGPTKPETVLGWRRRADDEWDYWLDPKSKIGYVRITSFAYNTSDDLQGAMRVLTQNSLKALVLDLRFNPGERRLDGVIKTSDLFIDDELIVDFRPRVGKPSLYRGKRAGSLLGFPMVCLINDETAFGSEIVAACLQDHKRALIVGQRSKGHASLQNVQDIEERELSLTTATCYRPSGGKLDWRPLPGRPANEWGVTPNAGLTVALSALEQERLRQRLEQTEYLYVRGRERPAVAIDRQRDVALAELGRQLAMPARKKAFRPRCATSPVASANRKAGIDRSINANRLAVPPLPWPARAGWHFGFALSPRAEHAYSTANAGPILFFSPIRPRRRALAQQGQQLTVFSRLRLLNGARAG